MDYYQTVQQVLLVLALVPMLCWPLLLIVSITSILYCRYYFHKKIDRTALVEDMPGVSIIKPLMGVDPLLEENLDSHFRITYPKFEMLFCVQDETDPAIKLVQKFMQRYPKVDAKLFTGGRDGIINPMVHNMAPAYSNCKYDLIWISTSRIRANTDILIDMVLKIQQDNVALVHQMPFTTDQTGLSSAVEKVYFGAGMARLYVALNVFRFACVTGMSYLIKKHELDKLNGLEYFGKYLAEDYFLSQALHSAGHRLLMSSIPAQQNVHGSSIAAYKDRMVRWLRLRLNMMAFSSGVLEPLMEIIQNGLYTSWAVGFLFQWNPYLFFACHIVLFMTLDFILLTTIQNGRLPFSIGHFVVAWFIRELLTIWVFFEALANVWYIKWGKRTYRLALGGRTEIVTDKSVLTI